MALAACSSSKEEPKRQPRELEAALIEAHVDEIVAMYHDNAIRGDSTYKDKRVAFAGLAVKIRSGAGGLPVVDLRVVDSVVRCRFVASATEAIAKLSQGNDGVRVPLFRECTVTP